MSRLFLALAVAVAGSALLTTPARAQDAQAGQQVFRQQCAICHDVAPNKNRIGPSLFGIVGRKAGSEAGFTYSDPNAAQFPRRFFRVYKSP